jgi:hypothetical protein
MLRRRAVRSLVQHAARVQSGRWVIATPWGTAECTRSHPSFVWRSPRLLSANAQIWRALRAALCASRRYVTAAYVVAYYPPAPLVVATSASGARLTDKGAIRHDASLPTCCRLVHGGTCISVACPLHGACCMHHAACCIHDASGAQGEWLALVCWCAEGTNRTEFPCGFTSTAAVCRTCRTLAHGRAAPAGDPCSCTAGYPQRTPPHSYTGSAFCTWDWAAPLPTAAHLPREGPDPEPSPQLHRDRAPLPVAVPSPHSASGTRPRPTPATAPEPGPLAFPSHIAAIPPRGLDPLPSPPCNREWPHLGFLGLLVLKATSRKGSRKTPREMDKTGKKR